jgi:hypothetical protein
VIRATARTALVAHARGRGDAAAAGDTDDEVSCGGRLQLSRVEEDGPDRVEGAVTHQGDVVLAKWQRQSFSVKFTGGGGESVVVGG